MIPAIILLLATIFCAIKLIQALIIFDDFYITFPVDHGFRKVDVIRVTSTGSYCKILKVLNNGVIKVRPVNS